MNKKLNKVSRKKLRRIIAKLWTGTKLGKFEEEVAKECEEEQENAKET